MDKYEFNRDCRRLGRAYVDHRQGYNPVSPDQFWENEETLKLECTRLLDADSDFEYATKLSMQILIRVNNALRGVPPHMIGNKIKIEKVLKINTTNPTY